MGRLGALPPAVGPLLAALKSPALTVEGIYTHFSRADDDAEYSLKQVRLRPALNRNGPCTSCLNRFMCFVRESIIIMAFSLCICLRLSSRRAPCL